MCHESRYPNCTPPDTSSHAHTHAHAQPDQRLVASRVGLEDSVIRELAQFRTNVGGNELRREKLRVAQRFFAALIIADLIDEVPPDAVQKKYRVSYEHVASLQERTGKFSAMVSSFCERLGWWDIEALVAKYQASTAVCCAAVCGWVTMSVWVWM